MKILGRADPLYDCPGRRNRVVGCGIERLGKAGFSSAPSPLALDGTHENIEKSSRCREGEPYARAAHTARGGGGASTCPLHWVLARSSEVERSEVT